ncbi:hypothetical protein HMPREF1582_01480 [Gardnerella vaginalis JCP8151A]|nr:hypothetical protein HMPREF1582_01480 [Gardnerella vaginalis JCP8151A]
MRSISPYLVFFAANISGVVEFCFVFEFYQILKKISYYFF